MRETVEAPTSLQTRSILERLRWNHDGLEGTRVLHVGYGMGESSVYFAL